MINSVFIVEGKSDLALIKTIYDAEVIITNGTYVSRETILYIHALASIYKVIVLTDPDGPGKSISQRIYNQVPTVTVVDVEKKYAIKNGKVGIAETQRDYLKDILSRVVDKHEVILDSDIDMSFFLSRKITGRNKIGSHIRKHFQINAYSTKQMIHQLKLLKIKQTDIEEIINE